MDKLYINSAKPFREEYLGTCIKHLQCFYDYIPARKLPKYLEYTLREYKLHCNCNRHFNLGRKENKNVNEKRGKEQKQENIPHGG